MQKSGIFNFQKLCQKTVGFLLIASVLTLASITNDATATVIPYPYTFGDDISVPNDATCAIFNIIYKNLDMEYHSLPTPPEDAEMYDWIFENVMETVAMISSHTSEYDYILAVASRRDFLLIMSIALKNFEALTDIQTKSIMETFCACPDKQNQHLFITNSLTAIPICHQCTGVVVDQWHCNSCVNGFIDSDNKCQTCPPGPDGTTVRLAPNATSIQDCYIDNKDEIKLPRGTYICGDPSGECHHPATTDASK